MTMENLTNLQAELILTVYENVNTGVSNNKEIESAFKAIPQASNEGINYLMQTRAINTFVLANYQELQYMATQLIIEQSDQNEQAGKTATKAGVKPKRKYKRRKKTTVKKKGKTITKDFIITKK